MSRLHELGDCVLDDRVPDDRVLSNGVRGDGAAAVLRAIQRVTTYVLFALAVVVLLGVLLTRAPTNVGNVIVRNVLSLAEEVAGPFKDVFAPNKAQDALVVNYLVAAAACLVMGIVPGRLPVGGKK
ncbi:MAG: hypothetical protein H7233_14415 [Pseudorhodobacter sp.]|nr:hypothetical protein [Frankiaceae bacterium]